ncbi:hypothetical protein GCM10009097_16170 [Pigmentiphaga daeguensis]|uniref:Uncharacterized protein n=1 Tax=Pigmentiphaga daeguensis TaxID=414049 RepID=A0ABN1BLB1_9BURK
MGPEGAGTGTGTATGAAGAGATGCAAGPEPGAACMPGEGDTPCMGAAAGGGGEAQPHRASAARPATIGPLRDPVGKRGVEFTRKISGKAISIA